MNKVLKKIDWQVIFLYLVLIGIGLINIYSSALDKEHANIFSFSQKYGKQFLWIGIALAIALIILMVEIKFFSLFAYFLYGISILSLILVLFFGTTINGATGWFQIGGLGIQPAEFAKIAVCLALAKVMGAYNFKLQTFTNILKTTFVIVVPMILILLQNDLGSTIVYLSLIIVLYREKLSRLLLSLSLGGAFILILSLFLEDYIVLLIIYISLIILFQILHKNKQKTFTAVLIFIFSGIIVWSIDMYLENHTNFYYQVLFSLCVSTIIYIINIVKTKLKYARRLLLLFIFYIFYSASISFIMDSFLREHQQHRINVFIGKEIDPYGVGYNIIQSKIAIGSGGFVGKGFLNGTQTKFRFVPEQSTDFIFCTIGEEWGFLGTSLVIILFLILLIKIINIAERQASTFSRVYGYGVASILFFHITINIGMTIGLTPVIGIPLPFMSYGGSSLISFTILLFILIRLDIEQKMKIN